MRPHFSTSQWQCHGHRSSLPNALVWCLAFICTIFALIIIIADIIVFVGYLAIRPKVPLLYVHAARFDTVQYDESGVLAMGLTINVRAENHNQKVHVSYYNTKLLLDYHDVIIAQLVADPFEVKKNTTHELDYVVESLLIPLEPRVQSMTQQLLEKRKTMPFFLKGSSRTRWRVGPLGSVIPQSLTQQSLEKRKTVCNGDDACVGDLSTPMEGRTVEVIEGGDEGKGRRMAVVRCCCACFGKIF